MHLSYLKRKKNNEEPFYNVELVFLPENKLKPGFVTLCVSQKIIKLDNSTDAGS